MILSNLLGSEVRDAEGRKVGHIADVRFVLDGPPGQLLAAARLHGLIVSPHSAASFLGYERYNVTQPWPLAQLLRWRHRGSFLVLWEDVARMDSGIVDLRQNYTEYDPMVPL
ncbi:PRC-barrel domain-containing protein [Arthrobacter sp. ISL-30]|uniref:PRC-barrel domain-containing protein n=1 Tax=Arthrobacter sp. ISL-30 TaxID=2819109 RepID=UPI001BECC0A7|nr:PRC-barrel domain-containing protein [Arthrobacter sp. ISL-30]MBT2515787.1 PRC-barrel domain-containing protein [Arthrobacter sp. ISL-30]